MSDGGPYGVIGIFATPKAVTAAAQQFRTLGFHALEAYTPYSVDGLDAAMRPDRPAWLPPVIFAGGVGGALIGYLVQYWAEAVELSAQCRRAAATTAGPRLSSRPSKWPCCAPLPPAFSRFC